VQGDAGERIIDIPTILMTMPEADLPNALLQKLEAQPTGASPVLTGTELDVLMTALKSGQGSNVVSRPHIATGDDGEASLVVGQMSAVLKNPDGTPRFTGTDLHLLPRIKDGEMIEVGVNLKYDVPSDAAADDAAPSGQ
jgi:type II secretory pathway component GspD/PulD (secretin)